MVLESSDDHLLMYSDEPAHGIQLASFLLSIPGAEKLSAEARVSLLVLGNRWPDPRVHTSTAGLSELAALGFIGWNASRRGWQLTDKAYAVLRAVERRRKHSSTAVIPE